MQRQALTFLPSHPQSLAAERLARFGRNEGLNHWLTLESWLGMVIDSIFVKAKSKTEEEEATIVVSMLGKKARKLVIGVQRHFLAALEVQSVSLSASLVSQTTQILIMATHRYNRVVKGEGEGPDPSWLKRYLTREVVTEVYKVSSASLLLMKQVISLISALSHRPGTRKTSFGQCTRFFCESEC